MLNLWIDFLVESFSGLRGLPLRIAINCVNGSSVKVAREVLTRLKLNFTLYNTEGVINTSPQEMKEFDVGFVFDGDGDRCSVVGIHGDQLLASLAVWLKQKNMLNDSQIVGTILFNSGTEKWLRDQGISVLRVPVGDKNVCEALEAYDLSLGGEESGHVITPHLYHAGDGLMTALLVLQMLSEISEFPEVPLAPSITKNFDATQSMKAFLRTDSFKIFLRELNELNTDTRIVIRPSGTEDLVRVLVEG
ncbi:MAG: hypothetical protein FWE31_02475 [Firmicutes bacterium]|nr:hypothetical protein [Bacillota bacterium]